MSKETGKAYRRVAFHPDRKEWQEALWSSSFMGGYDIQFDDGYITTEIHVAKAELEFVKCRDMGKAKIKTEGGPNPDYDGNYDEEVPPLEVQIGGGHYKDMKIQPVEYIHANNIPFIEGCIIKYVSRWRGKGGVEDLKKARHFVDMLIQLEDE